MKALVPFHVASLLISRLDLGGDSREEICISTIFSSCRIYDIGTETRSEGGDRAEGWGGRAAKRGLSLEQVPVLVGRARSGATSDAVLPKDDHRETLAVLRPFLARDAVLCSDGGGKGPIALAASNRGVAHRAVNLSKGIRVLADVYHIQNANATHSRLKEWMRRFYGVVTKYLDHYLGWHRMIETLGENRDSTL